MAAKAEVAEKRAEKVEQNEAATAIQSAARMHIAQQEVQDKREVKETEDEAATAIQSAARMHIAQQEVQDKREAMQEEEEEAVAEEEKYDEGTAPVEADKADDDGSDDDGSGLCHAFRHLFVHLSHVTVCAHCRF